MIFNLAEQGSEAWLNARKGKITGSRFKDARARLADKTDKATGIVTRGLPSAKCLAYARDVARERMGGKPAEVYQNAAMRMGHEQEPFARQAYETVTGYLVQEVGFAITDCGTFGLSLDGKIGDKGAVEIKTMVSSETLFSAVVDGDISEYEDQCHGAILFLDLEWLDLVLWTPDLEEQGLGLVIVRIHRDEAKLAALKFDLDSFAFMVSDFESQLRSKATANIQALERIAGEVMQYEQGAAEDACIALVISDLSPGPTLAQLADIHMPLMPHYDEPLRIIPETQPAGPPTLKLGTICERLSIGDSRLTLSADFLKALGFEPSATEKGAKLFHESEFSSICQALVMHIQAQARLFAA